MLRHARTPPAGASSASCSPAIRLASASILAVPLAPALHTWQADPRFLDHLVSPESRSGVLGKLVCRGRGGTRESRQAPPGVLHSSRRRCRVLAPSPTRARPPTVVAMTELTISTDRPTDHLLIDLDTGDAWQGSRDNTWATLGALPPGVVSALRSGVSERSMTNGR